MVQQGHAQARLRLLSSVFILLVSCSSAAAPAGTTPASNTGQPATKDELVVRLWDNPQGFDPDTLFRVETENVAFQIYNGLTTYDPATGEIVPDLADSWQSPDAVTWTFNLHRGVRWQGDYGDFTARDVVWSYNRVLDPNFPSIYSNQFANVDGISAPDDYTVVITLKQPDVNFLHQVASYHQGQVLNQAAVAKFGDQYQMNPVGTGPFMMDHFTQNSEIVLLRNDSYFKGPAKLKKITYRILKDDNTTEVALRNHEVDIAGQVATNAVLARLVNDPQFTIYALKAYAVNLTMFNMQFEPFSHQEVRQAFASAIDEQAIIDATTPLTTTIADNILPSWMPAYTADVPHYPYDPTRARALLVQAGYPDGFAVTNTGIAAPGGVTDAALLQQSYLAAVGIKEDFELVETTVYNQRRNNGDFELSGRLTPAVNPDTLLFGYLHPSNIVPKGFNAARYDNPTVTADLERARSEPDAARRTALYADAERLAMTDLPYWPITQNGVDWPAWSAVKGVQINKLGDVNMWPVTVDAS